MLACRRVKKFFMTGEKVSLKWRRPRKGNLHRFPLYVCFRGFFCTQYGNIRDRDELNTFCALKREERALIGDLR